MIPQKGIVSISYHQVVKWVLLSMLDPSMIIYWYKKIDVHFVINRNNNSNNKEGKFAYKNKNINS